MEKIGELIIQSRKKYNMTQGDLANMVGVSRQTISKWENGETKPDIDTIYKLCSVLDLGIDDFNLPQRKNRRFQINIIWIYSAISLVLGIILGWQIALSFNTNKISDTLIINRGLKLNDNNVIYTATTKYDVSKHKITCIFENGISNKKVEVPTTIDKYNLYCNYKVEDDEQTNLYIKMEYKNSERLFYEYSYYVNVEDKLIYNAKY